MFYIATPYSDPNPAVRELRYERVTRVTAKFVEVGFHVYSPITHNHQLLKHADLPPSWMFWEKFDRLHLKNCKGLIVLKLDGWEDSKGVNGEIEIAKELGIEISYVTEEEAFALLDFFKKHIGPMFNKE